MAKQSINVGTTANDKKGDSLRAAFQKVNANFTELYTQLGLNDPTLNLGAFTFTGSVMSTDDSTNIVIDKPITVNGEITVDGDITPKTNFGASLGTPTRQFKSLYVSNSTVYFGGVPLSVEAGTNTLKINNVPISQSIDISDLTDTKGLLGGGGGSTLVNGAYTVSLGSTGTLTVPANGIITAPIAQEFQLQAKDTNSLLRNEINLDPNNGTYMSVWSEELETSYNTSDWATGSWQNLEGVPGISGAFFTNAENLQDFWTTGSGSFVNSVEVSINGGARLPVSYDGNNGETYGALLLLTGVPATSPTTITSLTFYYRTQSSIDIDYNVGEILLDAQSIDIDLQTTNNLDLRAGQNLNIRGTGQYPVRIYTDDTTHKWEFDNTGSLTLPQEGKIYGIGAGANPRYGYMSWDGESSGDGSGYNTMRLVPDLQGLEDADQYIIIDPTGGVPGHIHIRAGGTQDNSGAHLYLGGEHSHVKISAGLNPPVTVMANDNSWTFGTDGRTTFPNGTVPAHSYGAAGDKEGMVVFDDTYIYYCTADYVNNSTDIWKRTTHGAGTW